MITAKWVFVKMELVLAVAVHPHHQRNAGDDAVEAAGLDERNEIHAGAYWSLYVNVFMPSIRNRIRTCGSEIPLEGV